MDSGIYALYWPTIDKVYIGKSNRLKGRYTDHLRDMRNGTHFNYKVQNCYSLYGEPEFHILEYEVPSKLNKLEISYIEEFDSLYGEKGLNLVPGGDSSYGEEHPNSLYSNPQIEEVFFLLLDRSMPQKDIAKSTGVSIDVVKAISRGHLHSWLAEKFPEEYAILLSSKREQHNQGDKHPCSTVSNEEIEELFLIYLVDREISLRDIEKTTGIRYGIISLVACGQSHTWLKDKYPDKYEKMLLNRGKCTKQYPQITNGTEIVALSNASQFCKDRGLSHPNLCKVLKGERIQHKGWRIYSGT